MNEKKDHLLNAAFYVCKMRANCSSVGFVLSLNLYEWD